MPGPEAQVPQPGDVLAGKYEVVRSLAQGGMGVVLEARHVRLGHPVAVKVLRPEVRSLPQVAGRFEREARAAAQIRGPHSVRVMDVDALADGSPFMVMEMLEGHDLGHELELRGPLPIQEAVGYLLEACAGMAEAHALGIVHRDLKPSNLFLAGKAEPRTLKVLDFGISKVMSEADVKMTATTSVLGTPLYMSPEQIRSAKDVDKRTDIWSLGVILYELLTGKPPFDSQSATALAAAIVVDDVVPVGERRKDIPEGLARAVMKALEKKASERFQSVEELARAIEPYAAEATRTSVRVTLHVAPPSRPEASARTPLVSPTAPTLEGADTLVAAPDPPSLPARATEPGWSATPTAGKTRRGARLGVIAFAALGLAILGWLVATPSEAPEAATDLATHDSESVPEQLPGAPDVVPSPTLPTAEVPSSPTPSASAAGAGSDAPLAKASSKVIPKPPPSAPRAPATSPKPLPTAPVPPPATAKNPIRL